MNTVAQITKCDKTCYSRNPSMQVSIGTERERDRSPPPLPYRAGQNFVRVPGYPDEWRDVVPRADGQKGERDQTYYGRDWVSAERVRQIKLDTDLLHQFATIVSTVTGAQVDTIWKGGVGHQALLDSLIANVVRTSASMGSGSELLPPDVAAQERIRIKEARDRAFSLVDDYATRERLDRLGVSEVTNERIAQLSNPDQQRDLRALAHGTTLPPRGRALPTPPPFQTNPAPPPPAPPGVLSSSSGPPQVGRPRPLVTVTPRSVPSVRETAAAEPVLRATDEDGHIIYGVNDKWAMLVRIMLNKPSDPALRAWKLLYTDDVDDPTSTSASPAKREAYLRDLAKLYALLRRGEGDVDWVQAPQHTGYIFFNDNFGGAVMAALADVRIVCGKQWATELSLMTHEDVRTWFARLVGYYLSLPRTRNLSRYGGTRTTMSVQNEEHGGLIRLFRRLAINGQGFYTIDAPTSGGKAARHREDARAAITLERTGLYPSDAY